MQFEGALIKEQGVTFGVVVVKSHVLSNHVEADALIASFQNQIFVGHPVVLMAQDSRGIPTYYGRKDIAAFLAHVSIASIAWKKYTVN